MLQPTQRGGPATPARCGLPIMVCVCVQYGISLAQELLRRVSNALIREAEACAHAGSRSPPLPRRAATGDRSVQPPGISPAKNAPTPPGLRFMPSCALLRRAQKSMQRLAGLCSYYGPYCILWHHPQKSMQRLTGLCSHYGPYCILCILFASPPKKYAEYAIRPVVRT